MADKAVSARRLEWARDETYGKGERWVGTLDGRQLASVAVASDAYGGRVSYAVDLGPLTTRGHSTSLEAGKRAAQQALSKAVRSLLVPPAPKGLYG